MLSATSKSINKSKYISYAKIPRKCILKAQKIQNEKYILGSNNKGKAIWNVIKTNITNRKTSREIDTITHNGRTLIEGCDIANGFNNLFIDLTNKDKLNMSNNCTGGQNSNNISNHNKNCNNNNSFLHQTVKICYYTWAFQVFVLIESLCKQIGDRRVQKVLQL
ncbi:unnamed protein product [Parnassius mnemosyne]|uniref:Uncharacterized protein n=1 Tax=Parnassius mnemosyne TaxID=213953 RepID=A0AAV1LL81_9NEOP